MGSLAERRGIERSRLGRVGFKVSRGHQRGASWPYSLEFRRVLRIRESVMDGGGQCGTHHPKRGYGEKKSLGKMAFGRPRALLMLPPECLLYYGPFSPFSPPRPSCRPSSSLTWMRSQPPNWSLCLHPLPFQSIPYSSGASVI